MTTKSPRHRQQGFTLVEIMVVIIILGLLATLVAPNVLGMSEDAKLQKAQTDVKTLYEQARYFKIKNGHFPSLEDLITPDEKGQAYVEGVVEDPWGNEYQIISGDRNTNITVLSYGPDGDEGTEDDISSDDLNRPREK